jgi:hypothetical protein
MCLCLPVVSRVPSHNSITFSAERILNTHFAISASATEVATRLQSLLFIGVQMALRGWRGHSMFCIEYHKFSRRASAQNDSRSSNITRERAQSCGIKSAFVRIHVMACLARPRASSVYLGQVLYIRARFDITFLRD